MISVKLPFALSIFKRLSICSSFKPLDFKREIKSTFESLSALSTITISSIVLSVRPRLSKKPAKIFRFEISTSTSSPSALKHGS